LNHVARRVRAIGNLNQDDANLCHDEIVT
jgi:hypothetical protein